MVPLIKFKTSNPIALFGIKTGTVSTFEAKNLNLDAALNRMAARIVFYKREAVFNKEMIMLVPAAISFFEEPVIPTFESFQKRVHDSKPK